MNLRGAAGGAAPRQGLLLTRSPRRRVRAARSGRGCWIRASPGGARRVPGDAAAGRAGAV